MKKLLAAVLLPSLLAGCAVGPNYKRPDLAVPEKARGQVGPAEASSLADQPWWEIFKDPQLQQLVDEALKTGYDVRLAAARVEGARAAAGIARADFYPQINYSAQFSRSKDSGYYTPGAQPVNLHDVNLGMTWEIDLWGRIRRSSEAALANYYATEEARRGVLLSLVSEMATDYFQLRQLDLRLEIAQRTQTAFQETFDLFDRRLRAGMASSLETASAEASLAVVAGVVRSWRARSCRSRTPCRSPAGTRRRPARRGDQNFLRRKCRRGFRRTSLRRRPDVREAEQQLISANALVGSRPRTSFRRSA
jgi:multidrug efflux system outer membrane protein